MAEKEKLSAVTPPVAAVTRAVALSVTAVTLAVAEAVAPMRALFGGTSDSSAATCRGLPVRG